jgi:hypothetical protein
MKANNSSLQLETFITEIRSTIQEPHKRRKNEYPTLIQSRPTPISEHCLHRRFPGGFHLPFHNLTGFE